MAKDKIHVNWNKVSYVSELDIFRLFMSPKESDRHLPRADHAFVRPMTTSSGKKSSNERGFSSSIDYSGPLSD